MPSHLHPRSRLTMSLFTTTLLASFLVVGLPHLLPCPSGPRADYADGDMEGTVDGPRRWRRRRRRKSDGDMEECEGGGGFTVRRRRRRECPVPKPGGLVGEILGFTETHDKAPPPTQSSIPPTSSFSLSRPPLSPPEAGSSSDSNGWKGKKVAFTTTPTQKPGSNP
jgi:cytochrome c oxidase assembly factor 2